MPVQPAILKRIWPPFAVVVAYILTFLALSGLDIARTTSRISGGLAAAEQHYRRVDDHLDTLHRELLLVAISFRELAMAPRSHTEAEFRRSEMRMRSHIAAIQGDLTPSNLGELRRLGAELTSYFETVYRSLEELQRSRSADLEPMRRQRETIIRLAEHLDHLNESESDASHQKIQRELERLRSDTMQTILITVLLGIAASFVAILCASDLEKANRAAHARTAEARSKLESLSRQLVTAQETERKSLSRELHDEIGQSLTALKLELARCEKLVRQDSGPMLDRLKVTRELADQTLRATRGISLGLRPPMLDDLGLAAALNWYTSDYSRRTGVSVDLQVEGDIAGLPESHRTCIYRMVQEALTNCAKHAGARNVEIRLDNTGEVLSLMLRDDGKGFDPERKVGAGLGLLSMRERSAELGGDFEVVSTPGSGCTIWARIPCPTALPPRSGARSGATGRDRGRRGFDP